MKMPFSEALTEPDPLLDELERSIDTEPLRFGRYEVRAQVGEGSMGRVFKAFDPVTHREVAVKVLRPAAWVTSEAGDCRRRFHREAQAAGALSHANIVVIFDVAEDYFVMEFLHGVTLRSLLDERGRLSLTEALPIVEGIADALDHAHRKGIVHRDIKPGNIMILPDGRPKVMDFGVAHLEASAATAAGQCVGSPLYMSPEQIEGDRISGQADIFALAAVAYEMLTGRKAFEAPTLPAIVRRILQEEPDKPSVIVPGVPPQVDDAIARGMDKDPAARFATARELVEALRGDALVTLPRRRALLPRHTPIPVRLQELETQDLRILDLLPTPVPKLLPAPSRPRAAARRSLAVAAMLAIPVISSSLSAPVPGAAATTSVVPPMAVRANLVVDSDPSGAIVWLDGRPQGFTPLTLEGLRPGVHNVRLACRGYAPADVALTVGTEPHEPLKFRLEPVAGAVAPAAVAPAAAVPAPAPSAARVAASAPVRAVPAPIADTPAHKLSGRGPAYPWEAYPARLQGLVKVAFTITEAGEPVDITVLESPGDALSRAVVAAVSTWRFEPARRGGVPVRSRYEMQQRFTIRQPPRKSI
jgi:TonB family protein